MRCDGCLRERLVHAFETLRFLRGIHLVVNPVVGAGECGGSPALGCF